MRDRPNRLQYVPTTMSPALYLGSSSTESSVTWTRKPNKKINMNKININHPNNFILPPSYYAVDWFEIIYLQKFTHIIYWIEFELCRISNLLLILRHYNNNKAIETTVQQFEFKPPFKQDHHVDFVKIIILWSF